MPSVLNTIVLALHATAFAALSHTAIYVAAAPLPLVPSLYSPQAFSPGNASRSLLPSMRIVRNPTFSPGPAISRAGSAEGDPYSQFVHYYQAASKSSRNLKKLAAQSASVKGNDHSFQKKCDTQLNSFHTNVLGQQAALAALTAEKRKPGAGLANYDGSNDIETLIKNTVNLHKSTLDAVSVLVNKLPILGPVLGPMVYDIKCFLDDVLNFCEENLDATVNGVQPLLRTLLGSKSTAACPSGAPVLGLCI
ncbi:hypothetical protein LshimejAT787_0304520 [Lyophyllum shimeji]|uniref:Uncharacterized protein n=1 Tax=Lyophyllum shimeji TaxID=47721 RepID=A0A9P3PIQ1_LYOSH|nr:hypothetical protein LshimejAT787_0304520 [Lyophyllum shimeji]